MTKKKKEKILKDLMLIQDKIEKMKDLYDERDRLTDELVQADVYSYQLGRVLFRMIDNFHAKNICYRTTSIRRFEARFARMRK